MRTSWWPRAGVIAATLMLSATIAQAQGYELRVTYVQAQQRPFTALVDITYDLETVNDDAVMVRLFLSSNGGQWGYPTLCQSVTGDVGIVLPGVGRHMVWDAGTEFPGFSTPSCRLRVTADDGGTLDEVKYIAPGGFTMGSPTNETGHQPNEIQHQVTLTHGFDIQMTEVTNQQYMEMAQWAYDYGCATATNSSIRDNLDGSTAILKYLGSGDYEISFSNGVFSCANPDHPVKYVTWYGSVAYCDWLSLRQEVPRAYNHAGWQCNGGNPYTAVGYRLPTEAEWEYACRAGSTTGLANGQITQPLCTPIDPNLDQMGWYCGNAANWTLPVAQKLPNAWGLYDMHGNMYEWCNDWYVAYGGAVTDPVGPAVGTDRVLRGGSYIEVPLCCRSAYRFGPYGQPWFSGPEFGFRSVRSTE